LCRRNNRAAEGAENHPGRRKRRTHANYEPIWAVKRINQNGGFMSFLRKLLGKSETPKQRVQVCVECGMPVADHKQWCSILQGQIEMKLKAEQKSA
jgi:hypothetical protein